MHLFHVIVVVAGGKGRVLAPLALDLLGRFVHITNVHRNDLSLQKDKFIDG